MYILKKRTRVGHAFFSKECTFSCVLLRSFAFFCVLLRSLQMNVAFFAFFANERCVLCVLLHSLQMNIAFFYVLKKRTQ